MSEHDLHIETVTVGERAILEIEAAYRDGVEPESLAETHVDIANAIRFHLKRGTVRKP